MIIIIYGLLMAVLFLIAWILALKDDILCQRETISYMETDMEFYKNLSEERAAYMALLTDISRALPQDVTPSNREFYSLLSQELKQKINETLKTNIQ